MSTRDLATLGERLKMVDQMLVQLLATRHRLALQVGATKLSCNQAIYRGDIEERRIREASEYGALFGLNPQYVASIMYAIIKESCMAQMIQLQSGGGVLRSVDSYEEQKANLLALAAKVAGAFDTEYHTPFSVDAYLRLEAELLQRECASVSDTGPGRFLDLGCGTGEISWRVAPQFGSVVGYDLSGPMLEAARAKQTRSTHANVAFRQADLDEGIPEDDDSASFVAMSMGTASDVRDIERVIAETRRVLKDGGRFLFSFYNRDALLYQWPFLPWHVGLPARINLEDNCLEVEASGTVFQIYARPYTVGEVRELFAWARDLSVCTYPTLSAVLPVGAFAEGMLEKIGGSVLELDRMLMSADDGAYIIVTGQK